MRPPISIMTTSRGVADDLVHPSASSAERVRVVHNPVDLDGDRGRGAGAD